MMMDAGVAAGGLEELGAEEAVEVEEAESGIRRDYAMEGHLKAIARWYLWGGSLLAIAAGVAGVGMLLTLDKQEPQRAFYTLVGIGMLAALCALLLTAGHRLGRFSNGARIAVLVLNALGLAFNALQLAALTFDPKMANANPKLLQAQLSISAIFFVWYGLVCWATGSKRCAEVCAPQYRQVALSDPGPSGWTSPFFWAPLVLFTFASILA